MSNLTRITIEIDSSSRVIVNSGELCSTLTSEQQNRISKNHINALKMRIKKLEEENNKLVHALKSKSTIDEKDEFAMYNDELDFFVNAVESVESKINIPLRRSLRLATKYN